MPQQLLDVYENLLQSLWDRMAMMLGMVTTTILVERAIYETGQEFPLINDLSAGDSGLDFSEIRDRQAELDDIQIREAFNRLVVNVVGVLAEQVGRTIADQIARKAGVDGE